MCIVGRQRLSESLISKVDVQICEAFSANRYPFPEESSRQRQMNAEVTARLRELQTTIEAGTSCSAVPFPLSHVFVTKASQCRGHFFGV